MKLTKKEKFNLAKNLDLSKQINVVGQIIVKDIKEGITKLSKDVNNKPFAPLSSNTIADKQRRGLTNPNKPLLAKGKMKNVYLIEKATKRSQKAAIGINKRDRQVSSVVHNEGSSPYTIRPKNKKKLSFFTKDGWISSKEVKHTGQKKREWFGVSVRAVKQANKYINLEINRLLRK